MKKPEFIPAAVKQGLERYGKQQGLSASTADLCKMLQWDALNGCYYFERHGMYHGVELDGYIHT